MSPPATPSTDTSVSLLDRRRPGAGAIGGQIDSELAPSEGSAPAAATRSALAVHVATEGSMGIQSMADKKLK